MSRLRRIIFVPVLAAGILLAGAAPAFASDVSNVCPVIGGPNDAEIKGTPALVPDKNGNPAHGGVPAEAQPGDAFWN